VRVRGDALDARGAAARMTPEQVDRLVGLLTRIAARGSCDLHNGDECVWSSGPLCQAHDQTLSGEVVTEARRLLVEVVQSAAGAHE
jgi:hypothetical protein